MFSNLFRKLVDLSPKLSLTIWKYFYEFTALFFRKMAGWKFMNYGFAGTENSSSDYNTLSSNMYQHLLDQNCLDMLKVAHRSPTKCWD
jgi:hypothetical protein